MRQFLTLLLGVMASGACLAELGDDWRLAAFSAGKNSQGIFYLANEIKKTSAGTVTVWTKRLDAGKLSKRSASIKPPDPLLVAAATKFAAHYVPPYVKLMHSTNEELVDVITFELIADESNIEPTDRVFWEIDCAKALFKIVTTVAGNGKPTIAPIGWQPVPPESPIRNLTKMVCASI